MKYFGLEDANREAFSVTDDTHAGRRANEFETEDDWKGAVMARVERPVWDAITNGTLPTPDPHRARTMLDELCGTADRTVYEESTALSKDYTEMMARKASEELVASMRPETIEALDRGLQMLREDCKDLVDALDLHQLFVAVRCKYGTLMMGPEV